MNVIILKQSMRQNADPEFSACQKRLRRGIYEPRDVALLNTRVLKPEIYIDLKACVGASSRVPIVVSGNELRHALS